MKNCEECGKSLGLLEGYRHPTFGKDFFLCSPCFDQVSESVAQWGEFVRANSFSIRTSKNDIQFDWKKIIPSISKIRDPIESEFVEDESTLRGEKC